MPVRRREFASEQAYFNYLSGFRDRARTDDADDPHIRNDNLLDGLIGGAFGRSGGGWTNPVTGVGTFARDKVMQARFDEPYRISDPELSALYNGNDIAKRIVTAKPKEMFRRGWCLVVQPDPAEEGDKQNAGDLEQKQGGESGPAAPGTPLVDPADTGPAASRAASSQFALPVATSLPKAAPGAERAGSPENNGPIKPTNQPAGPTLASSGRPAAGGTSPANQGEGADLAKEIEAYGKRLGLIPRLFEACVFGRLYGGGLLIMGADDGAPMSEPLDETKIRSVKYFSWIDRRFVIAATWYTEIGEKYGEIESWDIVNPFGGESNTRVHESRVIRFDGEPVDFLMRRRLLGWTLSVLQAPYDVMRQFDQSFQGISNLMADLAQAVMKIDGLMQLISTDQKTLQTRMAMVDMARSTTRMLLLDAENEDFERKPTPLTGVADTLEMQMLRLAASAEMPVALLFGREPSGLNATGDADFRRWYDVCGGEQRTYLQPRLERIYQIICAAKDSPTKGKVPTLGFTWHKLYAPSELEQANIRWLMAQADEKYVANEIVLPEEIATSRFRDGELHLDTEIDLELRQEALKTAELPPSGAEKAQQEQDNQQADRELQAAALKAKTAGAKPAPAAGGK
jgi:phage-related protein (TIGR01555 family)